ncbi:MAG: alpha/beta hydrolase, partial [Phycisphaerales bacterium]
VSAMSALLLGATSACCLAQMMGAGYRPGTVHEEQGLGAPLEPPAQPDDPAFWQVEKDIRLHHFSVGKGMPVLFVHGGPGFPTREVPPGLERLADEYSVHFYDQRGCGRSTRPFDRFDTQTFPQSMMKLNQTLGIAAQIADIERIRRILGPDKLILVGHSFGGFIASLYAAEFPDRVHAMVLIAPADMLVFPPQDSSGGLFEVIRRRLPEDKQEEYAKFMREYMDFSGVFAKTDSELAANNYRLAEFYRMAEGEDSPTTVSQPALEDCGGWMVTAIYFTLGMSYDLRDPLREVKAPVLVLHGDRDLVRPEVSRGYVDVFPNARFEMIASAGHMIFNDLPDEFADAVRSFLRDLKDE